MGRLTATAQAHIDAFAKMNLSPTKIADRLQRQNVTIQRHFLHVKQKNIFSSERKWRILLTIMSIKLCNVE